jgi:hypothetical protein
VAVVHAGDQQPRTFTPNHRVLHRRTFLRAGGWTDVTPYFELRDVLEPNIGGGFWNTPSADCYSGATPRWAVDVWSDHNRESSLAARLASLDFEARVLRVDPALERIAGAYGVTHVLSPFPVNDNRLVLAGREGESYVYGVKDAARIRVVSQARLATSDKDTIARLRDGSFDPTREVMLHDSDVTLRPPTTADAPARGTGPSPHVVRENSRELVIQAESDEDGFLVVADTFYPGWTAAIDDRPVPIYRANVSVRAVAFPKGRHEVRFTYAPRSVERGLRITSFAIASLLIWIGVAGYAVRRSPRNRQSPTPPQTPMTTY